MQVEAVVKIYERVFEKHCFHKLLLQEALDVESKQKYLWKKLASSIASLPEYVANHYENKKR